jgi:hypothetical protein
LAIDHCSLVIESFDDPRPKISTRRSSLRAEAQTSNLFTASGDEGAGEPNLNPIGFVHPHLDPPPSKGEDIIDEISNVFG